MAIALLRSQSSANFRHYYSNQIKHHHFCNNSKQIGSQICHNQLKQLLQQQQNVKYYSRFSNFFRKSVKEVEVPAPPFLFRPSVSSSTSSTKSSVLSKSGFVGWYLGLIKSHPVLTKSVTSSLIYIAADLTSQTIALQSSESYDLIRTLRMAGYGGVILGPTLHYWFNFMSRILPGTGLLTTVKKMALGQTVYGPTMTVTFFSMNAALQGEDAMEIFARLKRDLLPTMLNGVMYWPICDFITFRFVPVHLQVTVICLFVMDVIVFFNQCFIFYYKRGRYGAIGSGNSSNSLSKLMTTVAGFLSVSNIVFFMQPLASNSFSYLWTIYMTYMASLEKPSVA